MAGLIILPILLFYAKAPSHLACAILIHEAAHVIAARFFTHELPRFGINSTGFKIYYTELSKCSDRITVSAAGPLANILCALIFHRAKMFSLYSLGLAFFNLLPASCLDGGGILRAICDKTLPPYISFFICRSVSVITVIIIFALNCAVQLRLGTNISFAIVSVFLTIQILGRDM